MTVNTDYLSTPSGDTTVLSDLSLSGTFYGGTQSAGAFTATSIVGTTIASSDFSTTGVGGALISSVGTTVSANSVTLDNLELGIYETTVSKAVLVWRSGNTTYAWATSSASVG